MVSSEILEKINLVYPEQDRKVLLRNILNNEILQELLNDKELKEYLFIKNPSLQKFNPINLCQYFMNREISDFTNDQSKNISFDSEKLINKSIDAYQRLILQKNFQPAISDAYLISFLFAHKFEEKENEKEFLKLIDPENITAEKNQILDWIFACLVSNSKEPWVLFQRVLNAYPVYAYLEALVNGLIYNLLSDEKIETVSLEILNNQNISLCNQYLEVLRKKGLIQSSSRIAQVLLNTQTKYQNNYAAIQQSRKKLNWRNIGKAIEFIKNMGLLNFYAGNNKESVVFYQEVQALLLLQKEMLKQLIDETDSIDLSMVKNENELVSSSLENILNKTSEYNPGINSLPIIPYKKINALIQKNEYKEAEQLIKGYLSESISDPILFALSAKIDLELGGYLQALKQIRIAASIDSKNTEIQKTLAEIYFLLGHYKQAHDTLSSTLLDNKETKNTEYALLCEYTLRSGQPQLALLKIEKWIEEKKDPKEFLLTAAEAAFMSGDYEKTSRYLQQAIALKKDQPKSWILLCNLHKINRQVEKSIEALFTGLKYCPQSQVLYLELVKFFNQIGNFTQAKKYINELIDLPLESLEIGLDVAQFLMDCEENESAHKMLEKALNIWPKSQSLKMLLSRILIKQKEYGTAVDLLEMASNDFSLDLESLKLFVLSLFRSSEETFPISSILEQSKEEKIEKAISSLISLHPEDAWGNLFRAVFLSLKAEYSKAYDILSDYLAQPEKVSEGMTWRFLLALGQLMVEIGKPETAIPLFEEVNEKKPDLVEINIYLAESFSKLGLNEKAFEFSWLVIDHNEQGGQYINWLCEFLSKIGKCDLVIDQITQKVTQQIASTRELLLLGFLLRKQENGNQVNEIIGRLISAKLDQDETMHLLILVIRSHDYKRAEEILQKDPLLKSENIRKINFIQSCLDYYQENYSNSKQILLNNINEFSSSYIERILLLDINSRMSSTEELKQFLNEKIESELVNEYLKAVIEFDDYKEIIDIVPENWKKIFNLPKEFVNLVLINYSRIDESEKAMAFLDHFLSNTKFNFAVYEMAADFARDHLNIEKSNEIIKYVKNNYNEGDQKIPISLKCLEIELLLSTGNELRAASLLNEVIKENEDNPRLLAIQSRILLRQSDYGNAIQYFEKAKKTLEEIDSWILDAALEIGDHVAFITFTQKIIEAQPVTPYLLSRLLQEKAELSKLNYQLNELKSVNQENHHQIIIRELVSNYSDILTCAIEIHPEVALWNSINQSMENIEKTVIPISSGDTRVNHLIAFLFRKNNNKEELDKLLKDHQADPEINFQMAILLSEDSPEQSRQCFMKAIARNPSNPLFYAGLSFLEMKNDNHKEALQLIEQALQLAPNETEWQKSAMAAAELIAKWDKVIFYGEAVLASTPDDLQSAKKMLHAYLEKGDVISSERLIQKMKLDEDESCEVMIALGKAALMNNNYHKAFDYAHQANKNDPKSADPFVLLAEVSLQFHQYEKAYEYAQKAVELKPDQSKNLVVLSLAIERTRGIKAAIEYLNFIIEKGNHSPAIYASLADLIKKKDGVEQALQYLKSSQVQPNDTISNRMAHYEYELNHDAQAAEHARLSLILNPDQADLAQLLGKIAEKKGDLDQAIKYFNDAISLNPTDHVNYIAASNIFVRRREFIKALEILENGIKRRIDNWQLYQQAGKIYWDSKYFQKAEEYYHLAYQMNPSDTRLKRQLDTLITMNILNAQQEARI